MDKEKTVQMEVTLEERQMVCEHRREQAERNARLKAQERLAVLHEGLRSWLAGNDVSLGLKWSSATTAQLILEDNETHVERVLGDELG